MDARQSSSSRPFVVEGGIQPSSSTKSASHRDLVWEHRLLWVLMLGILALWGYYYALGRVDRELRGEIVKILATKFPKHRVVLDRAHLEKGQAILLEGLQISLPTSEGLRDVLKVQRLVASGKIDLIDLVSAKIPIEHIRVEGLELSVWPMGDGRWSLQSLATDAPLPSNLPAIEVRNGLLRIGRESMSDGEVICHDLKGALRAKSLMESPSTETMKEGHIEIQGSLSSSFFREVQLVGWLLRDKSGWGLRGQVIDFDFADRLLPYVPSPWNEKFASAMGLTCRGSANFECVKDAAGYRYDVRGDLRQGRFEHPKLPYLLENLRGEFYCRNGLLQFRRMQATNGDTSISVEADVENLALQPQAYVRTQITDLNLNQKLFQALPDSGKSIWNKLQVSGTVDAEIELRYESGNWEPNAVVHCRNVSLLPDVFPYPVQHLQGDIQVRAGVVEAPQLVGVAGGQSLQGSIRLERWQNRWLIDLQLASEGAVQIDPQLISALTVRNQPVSSLENFVRSLKPSGMVSVKKARFRRTREMPDYLAKSLELQFYSGSILYNNFRYPIFDIQGNVVVADDVILLQDFEGRHDSARISCHGRYVQGNGAGQSDLSLSFDATSVPFQEGLRRALPPQVQELWNQAQPSGVLDQVKVLVTRTPTDSELDVRVDIEENGPIDTQTASTVSLRPPSLPYLLNDISCNLSYRPGILDVKLKGYHDSSVVITNGNCRLQEDGSWRCWLSWLPQTRVLVDRSLLSALPENLRRPLDTLEFRGPVNVGGWTIFVADPRRGQPYAQSYDLALDIEDGKLSGGRVATGIRGTIALQGLFAENRPLAVGNFQIDSLAIHEIPMTNLRGRFAMDGEQLLFGRDAKSVELPKSMAMHLHANQESRVALASATEPVSIVDRGLQSTVMNPLPKSNRVDPSEMESHPDDIHAKMLSGQVRAHGAVHMNTGRANMRLQLLDADFRSLLLDLGQTAGKGSGRLSAELTVTGSPHNINTLSGEGSIRLRDADLYELPSMVKLFRLLSVRPPDTGAFETADVRFRIDGDRFPLEEFALDGDLISLRGTGWVNMRREIHLDLDTYVGRRGQIAQLIGPLISKNDSATLLRIEVDGTTDNLQMRRSFPGIETGLDQVFPDSRQKR